MALNGDILGDSIVSALRSEGVVDLAPGDPQPDPATVWKAIAGAIVEHFKTHAVVDVVTTVTPSDVGLQTYTVPPGGPLPTTGPVAPVPIDGTGTIR